MSRNTYTFTKAELTHRATLPMTAEMAEFLDNISRRCKNAGGKHMDRSQILRGLIRVLMERGKSADWSGITDEDDLFRRLEIVLGKGR